MRLSGTPSVSLRLTLDKPTANLGVLLVDYGQDPHQLPRPEHGRRRRLLPQGRRQHGDLRRQRGHPRNPGRAEPQVAEPLETADARQAPGPTPNPAPGPRSPSTWPAPRSRCRWSPARPSSKAQDRHSRTVAAGVVATVRMTSRAPCARRSPDGAGGCPDVPGTPPRSPRERRKMGVRVLRG
ncbi:hypothetical protein [Nonomuraea sp. LPB2021202275-12-8]|uniref:hypothetical protein n=1 Tax=Nonomuraea sp. LPB2021202275-12-8 TaxID=3120159 RepID=UPI003FA5A4FF